MNLARYLVFFFLIASNLRAAGFEAELEPLATGYRNNVAQLADARNFLIGQATEDYTTLLQAAEEAATSKGDVATLGIVTKELEAVVARSAAHVETKGLSAKLQLARRTYVKALEKAEADFVIGAKKLSTSYLVALGQLQSKSSGNAELLQQIASEKKRLIAGPPGMVLDARTGLDGTVWRSINNPEDKMTFKDGIVNKSWKYSTPAANVIVIRWNAGSSATYNLDKTGRILLLNGKQNRYLDAAESASGN